MHCISLIHKRSAENAVAVVAFPLLKMLIYFISFFDFNFVSPIKSIIGKVHKAGDSTTTYP